MEELWPYVFSPINNHIPDKWEILGVLSLPSFITRLLSPAHVRLFQPGNVIELLSFLFPKNHCCSSQLRLEDPCYLEMGLWTCQRAPDDAVDVFVL